MKPRERLHFVALQVANEVPPQRQSERVHLVQRFLDLVLAHIPKAGIPSSLQRIESVCLGHGDELYRLAFLTAATRRFVNPLPNLPNPLRQVGKRHKAASYR